MSIDWGNDYIHDIISPLQEANKLCDQQTFEKPTKERTKEIISLLEESQSELEALLNDLYEEP